MSRAPLLAATLLLASLAACNPAATLTAPSALPAGWTPPAGTPTGTPIRLPGDAGTPDDAVDTTPEREGEKRPRTPRPVQ